jgi:hypothetical protein
MTFYLGTHHPSWLRQLGIPLFISHRRLSGYRKLPKARGSWALDSGAFSELAQYGRWTFAPEQYVAAVRRYRDEIGKLAWAAPQDWTLLWPKSTANVVRLKLFVDPRAM